MTAKNGKAVGRRLERQDPARFTAPPRRHDGVGSEKRSDVEDDIARANMAAQELEQRELAFVRDEMSDGRIDAKGLPVHVPGQTATAVRRAQPT